MMKRLKRLIQLSVLIQNRISALVLVNDKNAVAINPNIWNTRKLILADILAFAEKHASSNFNKMIPEAGNAV